MANCSPHCNEPGVPVIFFPGRGGVIFRRPCAKSVLAGKTRSQTELDRNSAHAADGAVAGGFFPATARDDARRAESIAHEPFARNPRPHPREGARVSGTWSGRTRIAAAGDGVALVSDAVAARRRRPNARRGWRRCRPICANSPGRGWPSGICCRRRCSGNFWRTTKRCTISRISRRQTRRRQIPEQQKIAGQFNQFFELTPEEQTTDARTLSEAERAQMEKTLKSFEQLPPHSAGHACAITPSLPA